MTPVAAGPASPVQGVSGWQGIAAPGGQSLPVAPAPVPGPGPAPAAGDGADASAALTAAQQRLQAHVEAFIARNDQEAHFMFDQSTGMTIVRIVNRASGELVRQIPTEEVVRIAQYLDARNVFLDVKA
jgi:flagellar protein FlaG